MKFRRRTGSAARDEAFINLASLIDVVFVLLLFFVVTTTFNKPSQMKLELPEADSAQPAEPNATKSLEISITADGKFALNDKALVQSDLTSLMTALQRESAGDNTLPLIISADGRAPHQTVITAMDAAGKLGFSRLRFTTIEARAEKP
ncbi:biopolymer transport protein ExbD [Pseudomonas duriflava]|uniref:Biopolymer transport protein ExbD n=1 Tax=Pseudomonas duriflava TaxID=459528 RepID=A0A562Q9K5_9PSED|nr:biopolymer transporter ExbD [Pseudomonas duriflava]TWI53408.1 biopolymer transport protein ExbD [Pseudomonas duriflava]